AGETITGWNPDSIHASARTSDFETPRADAQRSSVSRTTEGAASRADRAGRVAGAAGIRRRAPIRIGFAGSSPFARASAATVVPRARAIAVSESPGRTT